jgi:hypothetical protein
MNIEQILNEYRREARELAWANERVERLSNVTRRASSDGKLNWVSAFELDPQSANEVIQREINHYKQLGKEFEWKVFSFDLPDDLLQRLRSAGFTIDDKEAIVIYDLENGLVPFEGPFLCQVKRVSNSELLADFRVVAEQVFNKDYSLTTNQLADSLAADRRGHDGYVGYLDGEPVSVGRLYTDPNSQFAGLYGGGTLAEHRSKGCYRALTAARARDAAAWGSRYLQVDALPTSLPILLRLGFVQIAETWACTLRG